MDREDLTTLKNNIRWYNEEIERKQQEILKLKEKRKEDIEKLHNKKEVK